MSELGVKVWKSRCSKKVSLDETKVKLSFNEFRILYVCCFLILYLWCYRAVKNWLILQNARMIDLFRGND